MARKRVFADCEISTVFFENIDIITTSADNENAILGEGDRFDEEGNPSRTVSGPDFY